MLSALVSLGKQHPPRGEGEEEETAVIFGCHLLKRYRVTPMLFPCFSPAQRRFPFGCHPIAMEWGAYERSDGRFLLLFGVASLLLSLLPKKVSLTFLPSYLHLEATQRG